MNKVKFTSEEVELLKKNRVTPTSKDIFKMMIDKHRKHKHASLLVNNELWIQIAAVTDKNYVIDRVIKVGKLAEAYVKMNILTKYDYLFIYNLEEVIKLFEVLYNRYSKKRISKNSINCARQKIADVWQDGMNEIEYNKAFNDVLNSLHKQFHIIAKDLIKFKEFKKVFLEEIEYLSYEQLKIIQNIISEKLSEKI